MSAALVVDWAMPGNASDRTVGFRRRGCEWDLMTYKALASRVRRIAAGVRARCEPGEVVAVLASSPDEVVPLFFGSLYGGAVPAVLPPPRLFERPDSHRPRLGAMVDAIDAALLVVGADLVDAAPAIPSGRARPSASLAELDAENELTDPCLRPPDARATIQFTSGSSGQQRAVSFSGAAVDQNLRAIREWLVGDPDTDLTLSWLPTHHDMGLVGQVMVPIVHQASLRLMTPEEFVQNPSSWLVALADQRATMTAAPPFALEHCIRRAIRRPLPPIDLSALRRLVVGAERLNASVLERFTAFASPYGLDPSAILPAYGLAEATLAVTGTEVGRPVRKLRLRSSSLGPGLAVEVVADELLGANDDETDDWLVSSGRPFPGVGLRIVDDAGNECDDRVLGEVVVRSPSLANGYLNDAAATTERFVGGELHTGDAGFLCDGELFVLGRTGDSLKIRGRAIYAESVESSLRALDGAPRTVVAVFGTLAGRDHADVLFEGEPGDGWLELAQKVVEGELQGVPVVHRVLRVSRGTIELTSSGKPRRRELWRRVAHGEVVFAEESGTR